MVGNMILLVLVILLPYIFIVAKALSGLSKITPYTARDKADTFISVIIPCRNEESFLPRLLDCLSSQDYEQSSFEVIVVNDNSDDDTVSVALSYKKIDNLKVISNSERGKKRAIREGVAMASGELIVTCDADCLVPVGWLKSIASFYEENRPDMIVAPVKLGDSKFAPWFQKLEFLSLQGITAGMAMVGKPIMCNGANLAFTKECYLRFSTNMRDQLVSGDDMFLLHSVKRDRKATILWLESKESVATTDGSKSFSSFISQRARWISKSGSYNDMLTLFTALSTLWASILQLSLFFMMIVDPIYAKAFLAAFIIKSIPDYCLLSNTARRYGEGNLMRWFIPCQLVYPIYVLVVIVKSVLFSNRFGDR